MVNLDRHWLDQEILDTHRDSYICNNKHKECITSCFALGHGPAFAVRDWWLRKDTRTTRNFCSQYLTQYSWFKSINILNQKDWINKFLSQVSRVINHARTSNIDSRTEIIPWTQVIRVQKWRLLGAAVQALMIHFNLLKYVIKFKNYHNSKCLCPEKLE